MGTDSNEIWYAMKDSKYRNTLRELHSISTDPGTDMSSFMSEILNVVVRAVHAEAGTLWYYSKFATGRIHPKAVYGGGDMGDFSLAVGEGVAGKVVETGESIMVEDCQKDPRWSGKSDKNTGFVTRSMICVPLKDEGTCFGCIQLINKVDGSFFDDKDLSFMEKLADEVAQMFRKHSKDIMMGCFSAFDDLDTTGLNAAINCSRIEDMIETMHHIPQYERLGKFDAWVFEMCCRKLWQLSHK